MCVRYRGDRRRRSCRRVEHCANPRHVAPRRTALTHRLERTVVEHVHDVPSKYQRRGHDRDGCRRRLAPGATRSSAERSAQAYERAPYEIDQFPGTPKLFERSGELPRRNSGTIRRGSACSQPVYSDCGAAVCVSDWRAAHTACDDNCRLDASNSLAYDDRVIRIGRRLSASRDF